ncbi:hypothetical protein ALPR1_06925 [Algoriphagus machipongonensis]|uniref:O-methyltransferase n=1 Tax=Algoriphagus machipongonensis TaxID=388413 RepID=A3HZF1_9BACT|nr:hypothetical protein ALPR1_06925 [Algoriphagus machipongonensis]
MLRKAYPILAFFIHWLKKEDGYSLQSPFLFKIYQSLKAFLIDKKQSDLEIEDFRQELLASQKIIEVLDLGAGSKKVNTQERKISDITRYSTSSRKFCQLFQFFCSKTPSQNVFELGTCMGISTRYLSKVVKGDLFTFEGSESIQQIAQTNFQGNNTHFLLGDIKDTLPYQLEKIQQLDFALIDANHTYDGTLFAFSELKKKSYSKTIIIIGDIHWSSEMNKAWEEIKRDPSITLSLDFYECGVLFFASPGEKSHYLLSF